MYVFNLKKKKEPTQLFEYILNINDGKFYIGQSNDIYTRLYVILSFHINAESCRAIMVPPMCLTLRTLS